MLGHEVVKTTLDDLLNNSGWVPNPHAINPFAQTLHNVVDSDVRRGTCQYLLAFLDSLDNQFADGSSLPCSWRAMNEMHLAAKTHFYGLNLLLVHVRDLQVRFWYHIVLYPFGVDRVGLRE